MRKPFDLTTRGGRYQARKCGLDVPKRAAGGKPKPFWSLVEKTETCWWWRGGVNKAHGYGIYGNGGTHRPHRWAWVEAHGPIPAHLVVCHRCDNKLCVRPEHLFLGTQNDNIQDKVRKNRQAKGERIGTAKLTAAQVAEIRRICVRGGRNNPLSAAGLARRFGVDSSAVKLILKGRNWKCV